MNFLLHQVRLLLLTSLLVSACGKDKADPTGSIAGEVRILDEFGQALSDRKEVKITSATTSAQTQANGRYTIKTPTGVQHITFEKPYIGTYKLIDKRVEGAIEHPLITLGTQPIRGVLSIVITLGNNAIYVQGLMADVTPQGLPPRKHRLFLHTGPVSPQAYTASISGDTNVGDDQFFDVITHDQLRAAGLLSGQPIHIKAYSDNVYADVYEDPETKKIVYPALSSYGSNSVTFTY